MMNTPPATRTAPATFPHGPFKIAVDRLEFCNEEEDYLLGTATVFGTPHHFQAVRVEWVEEDGGTFLRATLDPYRRLEDVERLSSDGALTPTEIPGTDGLWVCWMEPYAR